MVLGVVLPEGDGEGDADWQVRKQPEQLVAQRAVERQPVARLVRCETRQRACDFIYFFVAEQNSRAGQKQVGGESAAERPRQQRQRWPW